MNKKITKSLKVGIIVIFALFLLYFGLNFLKGINIFSSVNSYYAKYENLGGLVASSPVYVKGYKVGQVDNIEYDFSKEQPFIVAFSVSKDIKIPANGTVELYDDGLMGGKALQILIPVNPATDNFYSESDTIISQVSFGLFDELAELVPKIKDIATHADSVILAAQNLLENENLKNSLASIDKMTYNFSESSEKLNNMIKSDLPLIVSKVDNILSDFTYIGGQLKEIDFTSTFSYLDNTMANLNTFTNQLNDKNSTLGMLLNDRELYTNLLRMTSSADSLLIDLKLHPKRYVHFSVFGRK